MVLKLFTTFHAIKCQFPSSLLNFSQRAKWLKFLLQAYRAHWTLILQRAEAWLGNSTLCIPLALAPSPLSNFFSPKHILVPSTSWPRTTFISPGIHGTDSARKLVVVSKAHALEMGLSNTRNNFHRQVLRRNEIFVFTYFDGIIFPTKIAQLLRNSSSLRSQSDLSL
jgi:hypothetical protein